MRPAESGHVAPECGGRSSRTALLRLADGRQYKGGQVPEPELDLQGKVPPSGQRAARADCRPKPPAISIRPEAAHWRRSGPAWPETRAGVFPGSAHLAGGRNGSPPICSVPRADVQGLLRRAFRLRQSPETTPRRFAARNLRQECAYIAIVKQSVLIWRNGASTEKLRRRSYHALTGPLTLPDLMEQAGQTFQTERLDTQQNCTADATTGHPSNLWICLQRRTLCPDVRLHKVMATSQLHLFYGARVCPSHLL